MRKCSCNEVVSHSTVKRLCKDINDNLFSPLQAPRSGRPSMSRTNENSEKISDLIQKNPRLSTRQIDEEINLNKEYVRQILRPQKSV